MQPVLQLLQHRAAAHRSGWGGQPERDPGDGGVHPGLQGDQPDQDAEGDVNADRADPKLSQEEDQPHPGGGDGQPPDRELAGGEDRDHGDGQDVVHDRQSQ